MAFQGDLGDNESIAAGEEADLREALGRDNARPRRTIIDIRPFSGSDEEDISEWLIRWDVAANANNWTSAQQLTMMPAYLMGRAGRIYWRLSAEVRSNLDDLKDCLDEYFNTQEKRFLARQKLQEVTQGPKESVVEFSERVDKLVTKGHDGLDDGARKDRIACESFIKGLRPDIKETVWEKCPNTFQEALQAAERREVFLNSVGKRSRVNEVSEDMIGLIQKFKEDRIKSNQEIWKAMQGLTAAVQALATAKNQEPPKQPMSSPMPMQSTNDRRAPITCFYCHQSGHMRRNCPQRRQPIVPQAATSEFSQQITPSS
eukprot:Seg2613.3 transcript_id=Seg2613.3/GoldUCD/mRNA.D3Y31 product="hypothetical protein" protein_id=Seg2613.3/GoldUCD/D3Y31